jgi:DNA-binding response OmpR family regulator
MTRLLLVEDDVLIGEMIRLNLQQEGYTVTWSRDGAEATPLVLAGDYDVLLLDVMLPGRLGYDIARDAREAGLTPPILMLTARGDTPSKVTGLDAGADDYLTKPFHMPELLARVRALLRRPGAELVGADRAASLPSATVTLGQLTVDLVTGRAETLAGPRELSVGERRLLELMSRRRGAELTAAEIAAELCRAAVGADPLTSPEGVREAIHRLREWFEPEPERPRHFVHTDRGYRFES